MKRGIIAGVLAAGNVALILTVFAAPPQAASQPAPQPGSWHVELSSPPTADGTSLAVLEREEAAFHAAAKAAGLHYVEQRHFRTLWNGLTLRMSAKDAGELRRLPAVKAVYPVVRVTRLAGPAQTESQAQTGADLVRAAGITGAGVHVALIDSGIDYQHPDLGGCFGPGCRVKKGYDFVGDAYDAALHPVPMPDSDPDDCNGHGTHVAGIVGATGSEVQGVAPGVTFGAYRVFGCAGTSDSDIVLAAMERVQRDGADVLNMSLGPALESVPSDFEWSQSPVAQAADRLVQKGIVVVSAIGDRGAAGLYAAGAPGVGSTVIGVASFDSQYMIFTLAPDNRKIVYKRAGPGVGPLAPLSGGAAMARTGTPDKIDDACSSLPPGSLVGKVALIRRGTCSYQLKVDNATAAGAAGVMIYDKPASEMGGILLRNFMPMLPGSPSIPVVFITYDDGAAIDARLAAGNVTMTWTREGGMISDFSSWGLAPDLSVKPDLGAPGGGIMSTLPLEQGGYGELSGSSMASAHTAGAAALLIEARRKASPRGRGEDDGKGRDDDKGRHDDKGWGEGKGDDNDRDGNDGAGWVRTALMNSAEPRLWGEDPSYGLLDQVHRQGAGMLRIDRAVAALAGVNVTPPALALGESQAGPATRTLRITNDGRSKVTYNLSHDSALVTLSDTFAPVTDYAPATVGFSRTKVTLEKGESAEVRVTIAPDPGLADRSLYGGYLVFTPQGGGPAMRVPYAGFKGDYQSIQASTAPSMVKWNGSGYAAGNLKYSLVGNDIPVIRLHLDHPVRRVRVQVLDSKGKSQDLAIDSEYLGRNSTSDESFDLAWNGKTFEAEDDGHGKGKSLKNGVYRLKVEVLKALGDSKNPAHTESWTLPAITIARP
ncbi:MAG: S8 family serine peptidase [Vicinamibacterales bacterium]